MTDEDQIAKLSKAAMKKQSNRKKEPDCAASDTSKLLEEEISEFFSGAMKEQSDRTANLESPNSGDQDASRQKASTLKSRKLLNTGIGSRKV